MLLYLLMARPHIVITLVHHSVPEKIEIFTMEDLLDYSQPGARGALLKACLIGCGIVQIDYECKLSEQLLALHGGGIELQSWSTLPQGSEDSSDSESSSDGQRGDKKRWSEGDTSESEVLSGSLDNLSETDTPTTSTIPKSNVPRVRSTGSGESTFKVDDLVVVNFEGQLFPGRLTQVKPEGYIVSTMERPKKNWRWPDREDDILYSKEEILYTIESPRPVGKRGIFEAHPRLRRLRSLSPYLSALRQRLSLSGPGRKQGEWRRETQERLIERRRAVGTICVSPVPH
ncbi:hypothetical protein HPB50_007882 [Hyalomma asiaticum]|uniref:Uncharacterized protein n=1 Tax=Hyalomma asiaticum TaxID=266040 RepID=A0ACB7TE36_HYAAI|nr:hypothetical protein HPB50_007882 [Hyalomma asiaticum]